MPEPEVSRQFISRKLLDKSRDPWEYVDQELPTKTKKIFSRTKLGTIIDSASGAVNMGSVQFSGSHHDFAPGSYSFRVTRQSVYVGSMAPDAQLIWKLRHSREGTVDSIPFGRSGTMQAKYLRYGPSTPLVKAPLEPIYAVGPGTLWTYFQSLKGTARVFSSLEGIF